MYFKALKPFFRIPSVSTQKVSQFFQQYQFDNIYQQTTFCSAGVGIGLSGERVSLGFQKNSQLTHHSGSVLCSALLWENYVLRGMTTVHGCPECGLSVMLLSLLLVSIKVQQASMDVSGCKL